MILLTGGTGFIGQRLVPRLSAAGYRIRLLRRSTGGGEAPAGAENLVGDLTDPALLPGALEGVSTVVHLAGLLPSPGVSADDLWRANVVGTRALAGAARTAGISRFVYLSSAGVYGQQPPPAPIAEDAPLAPVTPYEKSKAVAERELVEAWTGCAGSLVVLRPAGVFGPGRADTGRFYRQILSRRIWIHGPGNHAVHPTYVEDVVQALLLALRVPASPGAPAVFNVAGERGLSLRELVALVAGRAGRHLVQVRVPLPRRLGAEGSHRVLDLTRARDILGFVPTPLEEAVDATLAWARGGRVR